MSNNDAYLRIRMKTANGYENCEFYGQTVWSILRRIYGRSKDLRLHINGDPNSPTAGCLGWACKTGGMIVGDTILEMEGPMGTDNLGECWDDNEVLAL